MSRKFALVMLGRESFLVYLNGFMIPLRDIKTIEWGDVFEIDPKRRTEERAGAIVYGTTRLVLTQEDVADLQVFLKSMAVVWPAETKMQVLSGASDSELEDQIGPGVF